MPSMNVNNVEKYSDLCHYREKILWRLYYRTESDLLAENQESNKNADFTCPLLFSLNMKMYLHNAIPGFPCTVIAATSLITRYENFKFVERSGYDNGTHVYILILDYVPIVPWYGRSLSPCQEHIFLFSREKNTKILCFFRGRKARKYCVFIMC